MSFKKSKLTVCIALVSAINNAPNAFAQDVEVEEIIVTGSFRGSLRDALDLKRNNASAVDSIIAEDIGDFPDNNLAEALQRIPGVNIDRQGGEGKTISVRGLSSDFSRVRVNGLEAIATGYGNRSRSFDFNIFASELFSRVDVRKTQNAEIDEGSLGATVDLYTARPLDSDDDTYLINLSGGQNELSSGIDPRISGLLSLQNDDANLGWSLSAAYSQRGLNQEGHNTGRWEANSNRNEDFWGNAAELTDEVNNAFHPRFPRQLDRVVELERLGITNTVQWEISDDTSLIFDMLNASYTFEQNEETLTPISLSRTTSTGRGGTIVNEYVYVAENNTLPYAKLSGVDTRSENAYIKADTTFNQSSLSFKHNFTDTIRMSALVGSSKSTTDVEERTISLESYNQDFTYDYRGDDSDPKLEYGFNLTDPSSWQIAELRDRPAKTENSYQVGQVDFAWDLPDIFTLKAGASFKEFTFENYGARRDSGILEPGGEVINVPAGCDLTLADLNVTSNMGSIVTPSNGQNAYFLPDIDVVSNHTGLLTDGTCFPLVPRASDDRSVEEKDVGAYVQVDFDTELADMRFYGNLGLRQVTTTQKSTGVIVTGVDSEGNEITTKSSPERDYDDSLPAINLSLQVIEDLFLRASWAEVMSRPTLGNIAPSSSLDGFNRTYNVGNPNLDPFRAKATDLSVEWYFFDEALISLAYFEKDIESFTATETRDVPWSELGLPDSVLDNLPATPSDTFTLTTTVNGDGGTLDGWELQFQTPFTFGPEWLRDFGIKANYTSINSRVNIGTKEVPVWTRLNGQSDTSLNGTFWYENSYGFQGRISYTYRSDYQTRSTSRLGREYGTDYTDDVAVVDASVTYLVDENIKISLDMLNLTNEPETSLLGVDGLLDTTLESGRQIYLGVQYSF